MASSYEESYKNCLLVHLDHELCMEKYGRFIRETKNLISVLEDLTLKMKYLSSFYLSRASTKKYTPKEIAKWKFFITMSQPDIKDEDSAEDLGILIQKLIHCLISSFKVTILIYKARQTNDYSPVVIRLCCKFLKCTFKVAAVFTVTDHNHKPLQKFLDDGITAMKNLAMIPIIISKSMIFEILEDILPAMISDMLKNRLIKVFLNCLLGHQRTSNAVLTHLLKFFSDIKIIQMLEERNSSQSKLFLLLFDDIFKASVLFPDGMETVQKKCLESVVKNLVKSVQTTLDCYNHLCVLKSLFSALHHDKSHLVFYGLVSTLPYVFNAFEFLLQSSLKKDICHLLLETVFTSISSFTGRSFVFLLPHIKLIVKVVLLALKENADIAQKALTVFENLVDIMGFDYINSCILPLKTDLLSVLYEALSNSNERSSEIVFRILGKMGGYNRDQLELMNHVTDDLKSDVLETNGPFLHIKCKEVSLNLPLPSVIDHAFKGFFSFKDVGPKKHCWSLVETFLRFYINQCDRRDLKDSSSEALCRNEDENLDYSSILENAFKSMFVSAEIKCLSEEVKPFMVKVIECVMCDSLVIEENKDLKLLIDAAILITCLPRDYDDKICINNLKIIINTACEFYGHAEVLVSSAFNYIVEKIILLLHGQTTKEKLVGCKAVKFFLEITTWQWKIANIHKFVRPILHAQTELEGLHFLFPSNFVESVLQDFLNQCFAPFDEIKETNVNLKEIYDNLKTLLFCDAVSPSYCIRKEARRTLTFLFCLDRSKFRDKNIGIYKDYAVADEANEETENSEVSDKNKMSNKKIKLIDINCKESDQNNELTDKNSKEIYSNFAINDIEKQKCNGRFKEVKRNEFFGNSNKIQFEKSDLENEVPETVLFPMCRFLVANLVYLHEDFEFCLRLKMPLFHTDTTREEDRILFEELKSLCIIKKHSILTQDDVRRFCGALYALCFNFNHKQNHQDLFTIFTKAFLSSVPEISNSAVKCLQFIKKHVTTKMMYDWACGFLNPLVMDYSLHRNQLRCLKYFITAFDSWCQKSFLKALMKHLRMWRINTINLCQRISKKKIYSIALVVNFYLGADLINVLNAMHITDYSVITNVMSTMFDIEQYFKITKDNPLKEPYMTLCQKFPTQVAQIIISNLKYNDRADMSHFVDFLKNEDCGVFRLSIKESYLLTLGISERFSFVLQILKYIIKYNDQWLSDKMILMEKLCIEWNTNKLFLMSRLQTMPHLKDLKLLAKFLLKVFYYNKNSNVLFNLMKVFVSPFASSFTFLKDFVLNIVAKKYTLVWKAEAFFKFQTFFMDLKESEKFKRQYLIKMFQYLFIPLFSESFMKNEIENLLKACNEINSMDVLKKFLCCLEEFIKQSEKVKLMFLKLSIIMAQKFEMLGNYKIFIEKAKKLAKSCLEERNTLDTCIHHSFLLLLIIEEKEWDEKVQAAFLLKLFTTYHAGDQHIVREALSLSMSFFPDEILLPCFDYIIKNKNFDFIVMFYETFYLFHHKFIKPMIQKAVEGCEDFKQQNLAEKAVEGCEDFKQQNLAEKAVEGCEDFKQQNLAEKAVEGCVDFKQQNLAVNLIKVIVKWEKRYLKEVGKPSEGIPASDARLVVNLLFRIASLLKVDSDSFQTSLSKKSISLLKDVFELKNFPLTELEFGNWVDNLFLQITIDPKNFENCEIFTLMTFFLSGCEIKTLESFVKPLKKKLEDLLRYSEVKVIKSLYSFLSHLIIKFPPGHFDKEFGVLYKHIESLCTNESYLVCSKASLVEAVGGYFESCLDHLRSYLTWWLFVLTPNYSFYDNRTALNVALGFLKKLFFVISEDDIKKLLGIIHSLVATVPHVEVMLKIIDIMELSIEYLKRKEDEGKLSTQFVDQISKLFEEICSKINTTFSQNDDVCNRFFEVIVKLKKNVPYIRIINIFAVFGTFTRYSEIRNICFSIVAQELDYNLFSCISYIYNKRWKVYGSLFWLRLHFYLVSMMFKDAYITSNAADSEFRAKELVISSLAELCNSDEKLAKYIYAKLFHSIWNILSEENQKKLFTEVQSFILILHDQFNLHDVLIPAVLKSNPEFVFSIDPKLICGSYPVQVHCCMLLEKNISSQQFLSEEVCSKIINTLTYIYNQLDEKDVLCSFIENSVYYRDSTVQATLQYKKGNISEAYELFKETRASLTRRVLAHTSVHEMEFCTNQMIRCASELAEWRDLTDLPESSVMQYICPVSKSNILMESPFKDLIIKSKFCEFGFDYFFVKKNEDTIILRDEKMHDVIHRCIKEWRCLPHNFLYKNHYSLLQVMQQLTELIEASHLVKNRDLGLCYEKVKSISSRWDARPYLLSDDFSSITEIFNVRQKSLENFAVMWEKSLENDSLRCNASSVKKAVHLAFHESNHYAVELNSIAMQFQNIPILNVGGATYSLHNAYQLLKTKYSNLLSELKKLITHKTKDHLFKKITYLTKTSKKMKNYFDYKKRLLLKIQQVEIYATLGMLDEGFDEISDLLFTNRDISKAYLILGEFCEKILYQKHNVNVNRRSTNLTLIHCLVKVCELGSSFECHKVIPLILYLMEFVDDPYCDILDLISKDKLNMCYEYWISYLPFLTSCLHHSIMEKKIASCNSFMNILLKVSQQYPQQVFFSLQSLSGIQAEVRYKSVYDEIILKMKKWHPVLMFKLEEISKTFGQFKTNEYDISCQIFRQALDNVYTILFQNFRNGYGVFNATENLDYLKNDLVSKLLPLSKSSHQNTKLCQDILEFVDTFKSCKECTSDAVIDFLKDCISRFSEIAERYQPQSFLLDEKFPALSSYFLENGLILFDQLHLVDDSSVTKIHKILPKVDIVKRDNSFLYKINVQGHNGKHYSYLIMVDINKEETVNIVKLMQLLENLNPFLKTNVECSRNFLKFHFPKIVFINSHLKLMAHHNVQILQQYVYQMHMVDFSQDDSLFEHPSQLPDKCKNIDVRHIFKSLKLEESKKKPASKLSILHSSPLDYFDFREKVLKESSVLCAAEFLNISSKKQILIHKSVDGLASILHLELNFNEIQTTSNLLTPCMRHFLGPFRMGVVAENIFHIVSALKDAEKNWRFIQPLLHLMKKSYSEKDFNEMQKFVHIFVNKLNGVDKTEVQRFLESNTSLNLCHANQFVHLVF